MLSFFWKLIDSRPLGMPRYATYSALVLVNILLCLPRRRDGWFGYAVFVLPVLFVTMLGLAAYVQSALSKLSHASLTLVQSESEKELFRVWLNKNCRSQKHLLCCLITAVFLMLASLFFTVNLAWTRYTDAITIFYLGFLAGEILYLLAQVPLIMAQVKRFQLNLNPIDPANTSSLKVLVEVSFSVALVIGVAMLFLNCLFAISSILFPHLVLAVVLISLIAWGLIGSLAAIPHFISVEIVQAAKTKALNKIDEIVREKYEFALRGDLSQFDSLEQFMKIREKVLLSKSFPITGSSLFSVTVASGLNLILLITKLMPLIP